MTATSSRRHDQLVVCHEPQMGARNNRTIVHLLRDGSKPWVM